MTNENEHDAGVDVERERVRAITALAGDSVPRDVLRMALTEGWSEDRAAQEFLEAVRDVVRTGGVIARD